MAISRIPDNRGVFRRWIPFTGAALFLAAALPALTATAQSSDWVPLGTLHDRVYAMSKPSLEPIEGGFTYGVFTDKNEAAADDVLPNGKSYRSSFLTVEVNCSKNTFRIARARFFSGSSARGTVVSEDAAAPGEGWVPAQPDTLGASFVAVACVAQ